MTRSTALSLLALALVACARPIPDRAKAQRGTYYREFRDYRGERCISELPLTVGFDGVEPSDFFPADLPWSQALGFPVTVPAREGERPDLLVTLDVRPAEHPTWIASTHSECESGRLRQTLSVYSVGDDVETFFIVVHELGHALGVDLGCDEYGHSCAEWSVMYPRVHSLLGEWDAESPAQWVRPADAAALRRAWRRR
jgi:hypothetical protein